MIWEEIRLVTRGRSVVNTLIGAKNAQSYNLVKEVNAMPEKKTLKPRKRKTSWLEYLAALTGLAQLIWAIYQAIHGR